MELLEGVLSFSCDRKNRTMPIDDILYIKAERGYVSFCDTENKPRFLIFGTMSEMMNLLKDHGFATCHRSYIVNTKHITNRNYTDSLVLRGGIFIPKGRKFSKDFRRTSVTIK